ncbi:MAG: aspartate-semialdehyde dehydrogenase, partial [Clostridia bacterium]|nr:aspartate-semialdehyde dehydrogenase [Clostridia bacterium]
MEKLKVGIVGATGMVGQRFLTLLDDHPYFEVTALIASPSSAGKTYEEALNGRWKMTTPIPEKAKSMIVIDSSKIDEIKPLVDMVFCAVNMPKADTKALEIAYAQAEIPVVSNNSANRGEADVPMVIPEINDAHLEIIEAQKKRLGTKRGFIAVKPNCSIQSYVPALTPLLKYKPTQVLATTYQAISGAGKTFNEWPEMIDNI